MSSIRCNRSSRSHATDKRRKKAAGPALKHEWDSTISDLSVHRAGPEDIARRRDNRVSKKRAEAGRELRQRPGGQKRGPEPAARVEGLLEQWQLREVLAGSDRALAVVRDLFGDAPRRQAGFPNVTAAPSCRQAHSARLIAQSSDRPTQLSILSESVMDSQALNETDGGTCYSPLSEARQEEADALVSMDYQTSVDSSRHLPERKEQETPEPTTPNQPLGSKTLETPCTPDRASVIHTGLNATAAIQRVKSRVESRADNNTEPDGSSQSETARVIRQVLNPNSRDSKKDVSNDKNCNRSTKKMEDRQEDRQLSLEVLLEMIENIDQEMVEYERQTGREVMGRLPPRGRSLTGFTFSLVSLISRLTHYLKENEIQQWQEKENHQQLQKKSKEQEALTDALTAELLTLKDEIISVQANLHQYMIKTDEELFLLKQMLHGSPEAEGTNPKPRVNIAPEVRETAVEGGSLHACAYPDKQDKVNTPILRAVPNIEEELLGSLVNKQSCAYQYKGNLLEKARRGQSLPEPLFGPAVLLSPPRQRNSQENTGSQTTVNLLQERLQPNDVYLESTDAHHSQIDKEASVLPVVRQGEKDCKEYLATQNQNQLQDQQWKSWNGNEGHKSLSVTPPVTNLPQMHPVPVDDTATCILRTKASKVEAEGSQDLPLDEWLKHEAMLSQIAELQLQNSALKAHLDQFKIGKLSNPAPQIEKAIHSTSESLQQRITALNRQSAEARSKLLNLIEQQRQVSGDSASPPISPIPPEGVWTGTGNRTLEVLIPLPNGLDSSAGTTPSPASRINRSRDNASTTSSSLYLDKGDGNKTPATQRTKPERLKEEGWFALSTHTMQF